MESTATFDIKAAIESAKASLQEKLAKMEEQNVVIWQQQFEQGKADFISFLERHLSTELLTGLAFSVVSNIQDNCIYKVQGIFTIDDVQFRFWYKVQEYSQYRCIKLCGYYGEAEDFPYYLNDQELIETNGISDEKFLLAIDHILNTARQKPRQLDEDGEAILTPEEQAENRDRLIAKKIQHIAGYPYAENGSTRMELAKSAMIGILSRPGSDLSNEDVATKAMQYADALIALYATLTD